MTFLPADGGALDVALSSPYYELEYGPVTDPASVRGAISPPVG